MCISYRMFGYACQVCTCKITRKTNVFEHSILSLTFLRTPYKTVDLTRTICGAEHLRLLSSETVVNYHMIYMPYACDKLFMWKLEICV